MVDIVRDGQSEAHLVDPRDYALVDTVRDCSEVPAGFRVLGSQDIELLANSFVNTEIAEDKVPSCSLRVAAACGVTVDRDTLAWVEAQDLSFVLRWVHPDLTAVDPVPEEFLVANDYLKVLEASVDFVL